MREVKIYATIQFQPEPREGFGDCEVDDLIVEKMDAAASALGGEVVDLEIK
ncbi:hypothetical protein [Burkholderia cepacia]|uniref:hypothetical protein n=1 Tax=Burkholderia cepacia TaxID=292 RepID=UPI000B152138|nr:hypothetical protein [Burkholderia cepacia]